METGKTTGKLLPVSPPSISCYSTVCKQPRRLGPWYSLRPLRSFSSSTMGENEDSDIIEHHAEEEMEKKDTRSHAASSPSFLESATPSDREGHSGTQSSHRLLAYSDALISIIATVMVILPCNTVYTIMLFASSTTEHKLWSNRVDIWKIYLGISRSANFFFFLIGDNERELWHKTDIL